MNGLIRFLVAGAALGAGAAAQPAPVPPLSVTDFPVPSGPGAFAPRLARDTAGGVWLAWTEPAADGGQRLQCAPLAPGDRWETSRTIVAGPDVAISADAPFAFTAGDGRHLAAAWPARNGRLDYALSGDAGRSWSAPAPLSRANATIHRPALATLADGRILAVWVDPRDGPKARLYTRFLSGPYAAAPDWWLARSVAPAATPEILPLLDGGAMASYLAVDDTGRASPHLARLHGRRWTDSGAVSADRADPAAPPGGSPRFAVDGGRIGLVWFGTAPGQTRILATFSPDAGARFLIPVLVTSGTAVGRPDVALLHDGALIVVWRLDRGAAGGALRIQRLSPDLFPDPPERVSADAAAVADSPAVALLHDYAGGDGSARVLVAFTSAGEPAGIRSLLVTVPEGRYLAVAASECHCAPSPTHLLGYGVRGTVRAVDPARGRVTLELAAVPGIMDPGPRVFDAAPADLVSLRTGTACLGRIRRTGEAWTLFDIQVLAAEQP